LSEPATVRLNCEPVAPHIVYDDLALDKILRVTAGHPYFLQLVCYTLVKQANQQKTGYVTISDVNVALDEMLRLGEVHFAYLWQRSSHAERAVLAAAAHLSDRNEPLHPETFSDYLQPYSIELGPGGDDRGAQFAGGARHHARSDRRGQGALRTADRFVGCGWRATRA
jgi:hypothetical protein